MSRLAPDPTTLFPAITSGVPPAPPKAPEPVGDDGSLLELKLLDAPYGLAAIGWLRMLKISARNWTPYRSLNVKFLNTEKSKDLNPESRKIFRLMVPNWPKPLGVMIASPLADA